MTDDITQSGTSSLGVGSFTAEATRAAEDGGGSVALRFPLPNTSQGYIRSRAALSTGEECLHDATADCADDYAANADHRDEHGFFHGSHRAGICA
jgi:hypothetical protein